MRSIIGSRLTRILVLVAAVACWAHSLGRIDISAMDQLGLVDVFPITFYVALVLLLVSFVGELLTKETSRPLLSIQLVVLIVILHATVAITFPEPRYAWSYKHFGVTEYIGTNGTVDPSIDIYQNWPGFFAVTAWFGDLAGFDVPVSYGAWAQLFFNLCFLVQLAFLFRSLTDNERVVWTALFVFFVASWVGQDYFAPQALAFFFVLSVYAIVARWLLGPSPSGRLAGVLNKIVPARSEAGEGTSPEASSARRKWAISFACLCFFAATVTHQLTPYLVIVGIALLAVFGLLVNRFLVVLFVLIAVAWLIPHLPFITERYEIFDKFDPFDNAQNSSVAPGQGEAGRVFVAQCARLLSLSVWGLALVGALRRLRHGRREIAAVLLMISPVAVLAAQSYGGEAIYRVFLFSLPWAALLAAHAIVPAVDTTRSWVASRWHAFGVFVPLAAMLTLFVPAYYGLEEINEMRPSEVEAGAYFYDNAPPGSTLALVAPNFPLRSKGNYASFIDPVSGDVSPDLFEDADDLSRATPSELLEIIENRIGEIPGDQRYLVLSRGQDVHATIFGELAPGSVDAVARLMATSAEWQQFFGKDDTVIYRFVG